MDRRTLLKVAAVGTAASALSSVAQAARSPTSMTVRSLGTSGHAYGLAMEKIAAFAADDLAAAGVPGATLCIVDAEGFVATKTIGWADVERRLAVTPEHLFQIGSISKSFAALCVYKLAYQGKLDLDAPASRYLPDFPLPSDEITLQQLLNHTSGLPRSAPMFPRVPDGKLWTGFSPGSKFTYCNAGYELIGMVVQKITGMRYPDALHELVIMPLGITGLREVCQASDRADYAIGYAPLDSSGPNLSRVPLGQAPWVNIDTADGNVGATAEAMSRYLHFLIGLGRGHGAPLFSDALARRFTAVQGAAAAADVFGPRSGYASGLGVLDLDGRPALHHTGGSWGFAACLTVEAQTGVGCFVNVNAQVGAYRPNRITQYACRLLRQVREGTSVLVATHAAPSKVDGGESTVRVEGAEGYAGSFVGPGGDRFQVVARSGRLFLDANGHEARLEPFGKELFLSDHPRFGAHFLEFERRGGVAATIWFGSVLYGRDTAVPQPPVPPELAALQGEYGSPDHFTGWWRTVFAQGERLVIENVAFYRVKETLRRKADYWYLESTSDTCERIRFEAEVNGIPQRLNYSGRDLWRFNRI